jgi:hypothetical protein
MHIVWWEVSHTKSCDYVPRLVHPVDETNEGARGTPKHSNGRRSQLPQRGRSLKRASGRKGGGVVPTSKRDKGRLLAQMKVKDLTEEEKELKSELQVSTHTI